MKTKNAVYESGSEIADPDEHSTQEPSDSSTQGGRQPTKCHDPFFAIPFYIHLGVVVGVTAILGSNSASPGISNTDYGNYMSFVTATCAVASILSFLPMLVMMSIPPTQFTKGALVLVVTLSLVMVGFGSMVVFVSHGWIIGLLVSISLGSIDVVWHGCKKWSKIPQPRRCEPTTLL